MRTVFFLQDGTDAMLVKNIAQTYIEVVCLGYGLRVVSVVLPLIGHTYLLRALTYLSHYLRKAIHFIV